MPKRPLSGTKTATYFIFITVLLDMVALGITVPILPRLIEGFTGSTARASLFNGVFVTLWALMQFFSSPLLGSLSDRYGRRPVILISCCGLCVDYIIMALAPNLTWLLIGRIFNGMTSASIGTSYAYIADITPEHKRAKTFGLLGAAFNVGFIIGPLLGSLVGESDPHRAFWVASFLSGCAFAYGLFILPESLADKQRMAFSWKRANPLGSLKLLRSHPQLQDLASINFIVNFCMYVYHTVFVLYATHRHHFTLRQIGALLALTAVLDLIIDIFLVGIIVKQFGNINTLIFSLAVGAIGIAMMGIAPTPSLFIATLFPTALWGLAIPVMQALMTLCVSEREQGQLQGANMSIGALAGISAPTVFGGLYALAMGRWQYLNLPGLPYLLAALLLAFAALFAWCLSQKMR